MAQKYVLNDGDLAMAHVKYHADIYKNNKDTKGGGYWYFEKKRNLWIFYSKSEEFGNISYDAFKDAIKNHHDDDMIEATKLFTWEENQF